MIPVALTIAGSDPSGGAGIQADLKTFHQFGVYGEAVITLLTVQNTRTVTRVELMDAELVRQQIEAVLSKPSECIVGGFGRRHHSNAAERGQHRDQAPAYQCRILHQQSDHPVRPAPRTSCSLARVARR
jgi:hypothetical protein